MAKFSFMFGLVQFAASFFSAFNQNLMSLALSAMPWRTLFYGIAVSGIGKLGGIASVAGTGCRVFCHTGMVRSWQKTEAHNDRWHIGSIGQPCRLALFAKPGIAARNGTLLCIWPRKLGTYVGLLVRCG